MPVGVWKSVINRLISVSERGNGPMGYAAVAAAFTAVQPFVEHGFGVQGYLLTKIVGISSLPR